MQRSFTQGLCSFIALFAFLDFRNEEYPSLSSTEASQIFGGCAQGYEFFENAACTATGGGNCRNDTNISTTCLGQCFYSCDPTDAYLFTGSGLFIGKQVSVACGETFQQLCLVDNLAAVTPRCGCRASTQSVSCGARYTLTECGE